jgi:hypothetical protein
LTVVGTEIVIVTVSVPTEMLAAVMSPLDAKDTLPALELNRHPNGSVRIKVLLIPTAKSVSDPSVSTMLPSARECGSIRRVERLIRRDVIAAEWFSNEHVRQQSARAKA